MAKIILISLRKGASEKNKMKEPRRNAEEEEKRGSPQKSTNIMIILRN